MRRLRYSVATSLDGFIAGPNGEYDWIAPDSGIDFAALYRQFDTLLMGRRTYETMLEKGMTPKGMGMKAFVASTTLDPGQYPEVTILSSGLFETVAALKAEPGPDMRLDTRLDIWLMGGGALFRSLLDAGLVDGVDLAVFPILLGSGVQLLPPGRRSQLQLQECKSLPSGVLQLSYSVAS